MEQAFLDFCEKYGIEPNDERYFFWLGGRHYDEPPLCFGFVGVGGEVVGLLDSIPPGIKPVPIPLYRRPVATERPPIPESVLRYVWNQYEGDFIGFTRWVEGYVKGKY